MDTTRIRALIAEARDNGQTQLTEPQALAVLAAADIGSPPYEVTPDAEHAGDAAERIGLPFVLKIVSPDIAHKTEIGGVRVGLATADEVRVAARQMVRDAELKLPGVRIDGFMLQGLAHGVETVAAVNWVGAFGPVLSFGLGGVLIEVLRDLVLRVVPVNQADAAEMIEGLQGRPLLDGWRGAPPADCTAIAATLVRLSSLMTEVCDEIAEIEINPLIAGPDGVVAADALVRLHPTAGTPQ